MRPDWLIIDGYNLLHVVDELNPLLASDIQLARHRLVRLLENTAHRMAQQTTIVFDGRAYGQDDALTSKHLEIFYSSGKHTADTVIERLVARYPAPGKILVVTSDRAEANAVLSDGAQVMSSREFMDQCRLDSRKTVTKRTRPGAEPRLGDLFPDGL
jgi:predicted RNA-binding protein with PIN domain